MYGWDWSMHGQCVGEEWLQEEHCWHILWFQWRCYSAVCNDELPYLVVLDQASESGGMGARTALLSSFTSSVVMDFLAIYYDYVCVTFLVD